MTFMLNYAWRRQAKNNNATSGHESPSPLAVQASEDTSIPEREDDENSDPQPQQAPPTPEGLRPRKSLHVVREELHIPEHALNRNERPHFNWPPTNCLPPRASPQVTNSSFYSRDSSGIAIAESPDLCQARTAVGALVGMSQGISSMKDSQRGNTSEGRLGMLPPRTWNDDIANDNEHVSYQQLHDSMDVWSPGRPSQAPNQVDSPQSTVQSSIHPSPSTKAWREWQQQEEQRINVSFSSRVALVPGATDMEQQPCYNFDSIAPDESRQDIHEGPRYVVAADANMANVSILSQSSAPINSAPHYEENAHYASHNDSIHSLDSVQNSYASRSRANSIERREDEMESALMQRKNKNQRRAKEQLLMGVVQRLQHNLDLIADVDALHEEDERWFVKTPMESEGLLTGFSKSKRKDLRKYIRSILNEMRVARPEEFFLSPSQIPGMADTHNDLHDALVFLDGILQIAVPLSDQNPGDRWTCKPEIRHTMGITSIPESKFKQSVYNDCSSFVTVSYPLLVIYTGPSIVRGGDTSVFSLPSDSATPCTSNVSLATTITSQPSGRGTQARSKPTHEAGQIRRSIEIISTLLQKMSVACNSMANRTSAEDSIRATEEIKRNYLQLMTMKNQDVRCVVDAFIVGISSMPLARAVSVEDDQPVTRDHPIVTMPESNSKPNTNEMICASRGKIAMAPGTWQDMFSPCTDDMASVPIETDEEYEADDLRRTVGSNDYDDNAEERDAPEETREESPIPLQNMVYYSWGGTYISCFDLVVSERNDVISHESQTSSLFSSRTGRNALVEKATVRYKIRELNDSYKLEICSCSVFTYYMLLH